MFPEQILVTYIAAVLLIVVAPGPDNILVISRGLSQGRLAAVLSSLGSCLGIMVHTVAAALGLALVLQTSPFAFWLVKAAGATYLLWLGYKAISSRSLISFAPAARQSLPRVFTTGLLTNVLNPKVGQTTCERSVTRAAQAPKASANFTKSGLDRGVAA